MPPCCLQAEANIQSKEQALQLEHQQMASVPVADNDIIHLNIGGSLLSTKRLTLTQVGLLRVHAPGITAVSSNSQFVKHVACRLKGLLWLQDLMDTGSNV